MKWLAPAKINLSLRVLGKRPDGLHEIETLMVPLDLADEITLETPDDPAAPPLELRCSDPTLPTGEGNLAFRAARLFRERTGAALPPTRITLEKRIPHGAGLGGGSSDAATVLRALNDCYNVGLPVSQLADMAAELGSDVPFFVYQSAALCRGRGERIEPVAFGGTLPLLLLKPPFPVPTPWAYQRWQASRELPGAPYAAQRFAWGELVNDLERPVFGKYVALAEMKRWLLAQPGVAGALMSGSGSTMLAVLDEASQAENLAELARREFGALWTCPCTVRGQKATGTDGGSPPPVSLA